jgi:hypothetical protein
MLFAFLWRILGVGCFFEDNLPLGSLYSTSAFTLGMAIVRVPLAMQVAQNKGRKANRSLPPDS